MIELTYDSDGARLERAPGLQFIWWIPKVGQTPDTWWGQLAGSTHRLITIAEHLDNIQSRRNVDQALNELNYHLENYFVRVYELRERVVGYLTAVTADPQTIRNLKHGNKRKEALKALRGRLPMTIDSLTALLNLLDDEIKIRNTHTHEQFLNIVLDTGEEMFDPRDALVDLEKDSRARRKLAGFLRNEIRRLAEMYSDRARTVHEYTWNFLKAADQQMKALV